MSVQALVAALGYVTGSCCLCGLAKRPDEMQPCDGIPGTYGADLRVCTACSEEFAVFMATDPGEPLPSELSYLSEEDEAEIARIAAEIAADVPVVRTAPKCHDCGSIRTACTQCALRLLAAL